MTAQTPAGALAMDALVPRDVWREAERAPAAADDAALLRAASEGDEQAFVTLYRRWQGPIYRFALHMGGSESLAEDVTQEVFVALAEEGHRFDADKGRLSSYLFGIARNLVRRRLRREGIYEAMGDEPDAFHTAADVGPSPSADVSASDPGAALDRHEAILMVRRAVCALPVAFREAVVLCDLQELSYADAAVVIGCPVGTVRSRLHRGRAILAERLAAGAAHPRGHGVGGDEPRRDALSGEASPDGEPRGEEPGGEERRREERRGGGP